MSKFMSALHTLYTPDDLKRFKCVDTAGQATVWVDVHGMTCRQARRLIDNLINLSDCSLRLAVIHGYNHGTALSKMVRNDIDNKRILTRVGCKYNPGITFLDISGYAHD